MTERREKKSDTELQYTREAAHTFEGSLSVTKATFRCIHSLLGMKFLSGGLWQTSTTLFAFMGKEAPSTLILTFWTL